MTSGNTTKALAASFPRNSCTSAFPFKANATRLEIHRRTLQRVKCMIAEAEDHTDSLAVQESTVTQDNCQSGGSLPKIQRIGRLSLSKS